MAKKKKKVRPIDDRIKEAEAQLQKLKSQKAVEAIKGTEEEKIVRALRKAISCIEQLWDDDDFDTTTDLKALVTDLDTLVTDILMQVEAAEGDGDDEEDGE